MHLDKDYILELLLDLLGRKSAQDFADQLRKAGSEEWQQIVDLAGYHGVAPLLYSRLKAFPAETNIPADIFEQLRDAYLQNGVRNTLVYHELSGVLKALADYRIPVVLIKGGYLAENVYRNIALRTMQDIDILLRKDDLQQGEKALKDIGYSASRDFLPGVDTDNYQHLLPLQKKNAIPIEIHWYLGNPDAPFKLDLDGVWERAQICRISAQETLTLCPEDMMLYFCIHCAYQHSFEMGLLQFCDISELLQEFADEIDWGTVFMRASEWGCERCLYLTLRMTEELTGVSLPGRVRQQIDSEAIDPQIISAVYRHMFRSPDAGGLAPSLPRVMESEGIGEKVSVVAGRIFPNRKEMARLYPVEPDSTKVFLYYPVRFRDLLVRYGRGFWRMFARDKATMESVEHRMKGEELRKWLGGDKD